jgi:hypothetical protein
MTVVPAIRENLGEMWLPSVYREKVRSQRTRSYALDVPQRENSPEILYTLLGIELKVGNRRFSCPDLATARYLRVFARLGAAEFAVPYDITRISPAADELETAWQNALLYLNQETRDRTERGRARFKSELIKEMRLEIAEIGAGDLMPEFKKSTKQRK